MNIMDINNIVFTGQLLKNHPYNRDTGLLNVTEDFELTYATDEKLGFIYSPERTIFRLWAPVASRIALILFNHLYEDGTYLYPPKDMNVDYWNTH